MITLILKIFWHATVFMLPTCFAAPGADRAVVEARSHRAAQAAAGGFEGGSPQGSP